MNKLQPPRWADRFLEWYCRPDLLEEIQGDAHELFHRTARTARHRARAQFVWTVIRFFRWRNIKRSKKSLYRHNHTDMLKSYLITGFRNIIRNLTPSVINIAGLSVALGCAILIFILEDSYYHLDAMHEKGSRIYEVVTHVQDGNRIQMTASTPAPLAALLQENSAVEKVMRARRYSGSVRVGDRVFKERLFFADPTFLETFSFPVVAGNRQALQNRNQILISESAAKKYFGTVQPLGQTLSIKFSENQREEFTVGGLLEDTSPNSSMYFDYLLPMAVWESLQPERVTDWAKNSCTHFVLLKETAHPSQLQSTLETFQKTQNLSSSLWPVKKTELIALPDVAHRSYEINDSLSWSNHPSAMIAFGIIAVFLILLACFNYMNVALASVSTRLKEIGIRKVVGSGKSDIIRQFLVENILLVGFSLLFGTALAYFFLVPGFNSLYDVKIVFAFSSWSTILLFFGGLLIIVALISGAYPALYVSSFNAVSILKGKEKFGSKSLFSRILLGAQFTLSFTSVVACQVLIWSSYYFEGRDWGYNQQQTVVVPLTAAAQYPELKSRVMNHQQVVSFAGSQQHIGKSSATGAVRVGSENSNVEHFPVGFGYLESMNVRLKEGRLFDERVQADRTESVVVNESFVKMMGWTKALDQSFQLDSVNRHVVGVVEDFRYDDFFTAIEPVAISITTEDQFNYFVVKAEIGHAGELLDFLQTEWHAVAPEDPYNGFMQSEVFESFLRGNRSNNKVLYFVSVVAILLVAMGLYGLVSYNLTRRLREFGVRKIFGASDSTLFRLMNRDYAWTVAIAFLVGAPVGAWLMNMMLSSLYPDRIPQTAWPYIISISTMAVIVIVTTGGLLRKVLNDNPAKTLRTE